jgi:hypothetical protein
MSIAKLVTLLPPPAHPRDTGSSNQWLAGEARLQSALPRDYKAYIDMYGTGVIGYLVRPHNPFASAPLFDLFAQIETITHTRRFYAASFGADWCPYPLYPELDGLLPWGNTLDGDTLFWHMHGPADSWSTIIAEVKSKTFETFAGSMSEFLYAIIQGTFQSDILAPIRHDRLYEVSAS